MPSHTFYQNCLRDELVQRRARNPRYSSRAFAKALGLDAGALSRILSGSQIPSFKVCQQLFGSLEISPTQQKKFLHSVARTRRARGLKRTDPAFKSLELTEDPRLEVDATEWHLIADWYHGAIMELTFADNLHSRSKWIAAQLGISELEAEQAIHRLENAGLLAKNASGEWIKTHQQVTTRDKQKTSTAHKKLQRQILEKAIVSLEEDPLPVRNMTSMAMTIDPAKLPAAKTMIQEFTRHLCEFLESGERKQVYQMSFGLFPLQRPPQRTQK